MGLLMVVVLSVCAVLSVGLRIGLHRANEERNEMTVASPLSEAVSQLVGIAGGIYVALVLLFGFLEVEFPAQIRIGTVSCNPLALLSMLLACAQPMVPFVWQIILRRR